MTDMRVYFENKTILFMLKKRKKYGCEVEYCMTQRYEVKIWIFFKHPGKTYTSYKRHWQYHSKGSINNMKKSKQKCIGQYQREKRQMKTGELLHKEASIEKLLCNTNGKKQEQKM